MEKIGTLTRNSMRSKDGVVHNINLTVMGALDTDTSPVGGYSPLSRITHILRELSIYLEQDLNKTQWEYDPKSRTTKVVINLSPLAIASLLRILPNDRMACALNEIDLSGTVSLEWDDDLHAFFYHRGMLFMLAGVAESDRAHLKLSTYRGKLLATIIKNSHYHLTGIAKP